MPLPSTIRAFYGGNSSPYPAFDQSTYGRHLTAMGSPSTPASPTPPEGDQWLLGGSDPANLWQMPLSAFPSGAFNGVVAFKMKYHPDFFPPIGQSNAFQIKAGSQFVFRLDFDNIVGHVRFVFAAGAFDTKVISIPHGLSDGDSIIWRLESRPSGCDLKKNGVSLGTHASQAAMGAVSSAVIGDENFANSSFIDAFMISDNPDEAFPSSGIPWSGVSRVRRR